MRLNDIHMLFQMDEVDCYLDNTTLHWCYWGKHQKIEITMTFAMKLKCQVVGLQDAILRTHYLFDARLGLETMGSSKVQDLCLVNPPKPSVDGR